MDKWLREPPRGEMFIWARYNGDGGWGLGLGYWTMSGGWRDSVGSDITGATMFHRLPDPPTTT